MTIKTFRLALAFAVLALGLVVLAPAAKAELTKADVEKIIADYIQKNPEAILKSVDDYQRQGMAARQSDALKQNHAELFLSERSPSAGKADGDVVVVEFFDYNCGYCKRAAADVKSLLDSDKNVKVIFKDFPILGPSSELASKWALAAHKQNKYLAFHESLMSHSGAISEGVLMEIARKSGLDVERARKDSTGQDIMIQLEKNRSLAGQLGLSGTPAFVIGDEVIPGAIPRSELRARVEAARKKPAAAGEKPEDKKIEDKKTDDKPADDKKTP